jgi:hypothetical protein
MDREQLRQHLSTAESGSTRRRADGTGLVARIASACWPGGGDRSERFAREWLRRWRPEKLGVELPACSCSQGHCSVCN